MKERYDGMIDKTNNEFMLLGKKIEGLPANERQWTQKLQGSITAISGDAQAFADLVGKSELEQQVGSGLNNIFIFSVLREARSRLYRRQLLQQNIRWKALDEIYNIYMLLRRSDLNISAKF